MRDMCRKCTVAWLDHLVLRNVCAFTIGDNYPGCDPEIMAAFKGGEEMTFDNVHSIECEPWVVEQVLRRVEAGKYPMLECIRVHERVPMTPAQHARLHRLAVPVYHVDGLWRVSEPYIITKPDEFKRMEHWAKKGPCKFYEGWYGTCVEVRGVGMWEVLVFDF